MNDIGTFMVRADRTDLMLTDAHLIESEIATRVVTHCGREMERTTRRGTLRTAYDAESRCLRCTGAAARA